MPPKQLFVVPDLGGRATGGTVYNRRLLAALSALGQPAQVSDLAGASRALEAEGFDVVWLDSLYLDALPELGPQLRGVAELGLILHYLPSFVSVGAAVGGDQLSLAERRALAVANRVLVTSEYMRSAVQRLGVSEHALLCVEPACELVTDGERPSPSCGVRALLVAHVVAAKRIEPLLRALAVELQVDDRFWLRIVGDTLAEPDYAAGCAELLRTHPALSARVVMCGARSEDQVVAELVASNLLVSASAMESYGMALAEGRRAGLCLLGCDAGNVRAHVLREAGGELVADPQELARACVRLCRAPGEHARRLAAASERTPVARSWQTAALELISLL